MKKKLNRIKTIKINYHKKTFLQKKRKIKKD